jgi:hypothetical protein
MKVFRSIWNVQFSHEPFRSLPSGGRHYLQLKKGKALVLQAWSGPEAYRELRFPDYMTTQDGGKVVSVTHRPPFPPGNAPGVHFS